MTVQDRTTDVADIEWEYKGSNLLLEVVYEKDEDLNFEVVDIQFLDVEALRENLEENLEKLKELL